MFDFSNLKSLFGSQSPDGGWTSGTTVNPTGAFFSQSPDGSVAGITPTGMKTGMGALGRGMMGAAEQMPGGFKPPQGAFGSLSQNPQADPNATDPSGGWDNLIASWRKHMTPTGGQ